ncbi:2-octaprenyl-6-methoxyphenyl hydroxylase [Thiothrix litoralis]|jgi:2-octaprenyl-6-methoxyphenol hydroxylase|uniref:2-octaprenyl-6-methoxyphenyl hydroxylase n=2 Tax=Thiothrix TaxID=1030 RepID=A0ABY9MS63_9GAMM|nr:MULTISPECIES: 2-octaprenyl-6-methoxyphenyl hydroxylase [Thiothrix]QTR44693.1 2-octaprenyl-6-methoxyphenyl hydroxylase [Thiothrix litoralis]WML91494.1 2-octaprenyl-6-methoxyphenyl hydroxylase [Thiothrix lacustris]
MFDILIVGGGMVGASLAVALKPLKLKIGLIEAFNFGVAEQPSYDDRSIALSYGSSRIYQGMGLWEKLRAGVESIQHIHISDRGHFGATRLEATQEKVPALGYVVESRVLGKLLYEELTQDANIELIVPAKVFAVTQDADSVQVSIERDGVVDSVQTRLLVVSDGANSAVRDMLGIAATRREYHQTALIANVTTAEPHQQRAYERFTPNGPLALLPLTEGRYSLVWTHRDEDVAATMALDDAAFLRKLQAEFGYRQGEFVRVGQRATYPLVLQKAVREVAGRAVVIGNSSHALHPVAGQGLNLGLRDVATLADLLAEAARHGTDPGDATLLADYEQRRQPDYQAVVQYTDTLVRIFSNDFAPLGHARAGGLLAVDRVPALRHWITQQSMGLRHRQARLSRGLGLQV